MDLKLRKYKFFLLALTVVGCGSKSSQNDSSTPVSLVAGSEIGSFFDRYPQISEDGAKVAFVSRRALSEESTGGVPKVYIYTDGLEQLTEAEDSLNDGRELNFALSPNGTLVAVFSRVPTDNGDISKLWVFLSDGTAVNEIEIGEDDWIENLSFSVNSSLLSFSKYSDSVVTVEYYDLDPTTGVVGGHGATESDEELFQLTSSDTNSYLMTKTKGIFADTYTLYEQIAGPSLTLIASKTLQLNEKPAILSPKGFMYYNQKETPRIKARLGNRLTAENESGTGKVFVEQELISLDFALEPINLGFEGADFLALEPMEPVSIENRSDVSLVMGGDYYICTNSVLFGSTLTLVNHSTNASVSFMVTTDATSKVPNGISSDPCSVAQDYVASILQPFENRIVAAKLSGSSANNLSLVIESWDTGDPEIYKIDFEVTDFTSSANAKASIKLVGTVKSISANPYVAQ